MDHGDWPASFEIIYRAYCDKESSESGSSVTAKSKTSGTHTVEEGEDADFQKPLAQDQTLHDVKNHEQHQASSK